MVRGRRPPEEAIMVNHSSQAGPQGPQVPAGHGQGRTCRDPGSAAAAGARRWEPWESSRWAAWSAPASARAARKPNGVAIACRQGGRVGVNQYVMEPLADAGDVESTGLPQHSSDAARQCRGHHVHGVPAFASPSRSVATNRTAVANSSSTRSAPSPRAHHHRNGEPPAMRSRRRPRRLREILSSLVATTATFAPQRSPLSAPSRCRWVGASTCRC